jgi:phospholipid/cholesterol/gamma-HCH transport system substrate-binding protein
MGIKGGTEVKVGIFVFIGILALIYLTFKITSEAVSPKDTYKIYAVFENVSGLTKGAKVEMAGIVIGKVGGIELTENGKAKVELWIYKKYKILKGAKAIIRTFGVLGDKYVEIKQGKIKVALKPGEIIKYTESSIEIDQVLADLAPTLKTLKEFVGSSQTQEDFKKTVRNIREASEFLKKIVKNLETGNGTLGKLLVSDKLYNELLIAVKNINKITYEMEEGNGTFAMLLKDKKLYDDIKQMVKELTTVSKKINYLAERIEKGEGTLGKLFKEEDIYLEFKKLSKDLSNIIADLKRGKGTIGKLLKDESLYIETQKTLRSVNRAAQAIEEQVPITVLSTIVGSVMK